MYGNFSTFYLGVSENIRYAFNGKKPMATLFEYKKTLKKPF